DGGRQPQVSRARKLVLRRRSAVHLSTQDFTDLYGGGSHTAGNRVDQYALWLSMIGTLKKTCLPKGKVGGEVIHRKCRCLLCAPSFGNGPQQLRPRRRLFGEGRP